MDRLVLFLKDVRAELAKVNWPTRHETIRYTGMVIGMSIVVAIFLGFWDYLFQYILQRVVIK